LVAHDRIRVRIAIVDGGSRNSLFHEKIGIFRDGDGDFLASSGSANETRSAYRGNFERIDVFQSNGPDARRVRRIRSQFDLLWKSETEGLEVMDLREALDRDIFEWEPRMPGEPEDLDGGEAARVVSEPETLVPATDISLRPHQLAAVRSWARAGGRGILEMATGTGKTVTALGLASKLYDAQGGPLALMVSVPFIHLADQWIDAAKMYGLKPIRCAEGRASWYAPLSAAVGALNSERRSVLSFVVTNATLQTSAFQDALEMIRAPLLYIADEMHDLGTRRAAAALPQHASARVGLSATPDRARDREGNERLGEYFGDIAFRYGLKEAMKDKVLTPYRYYPIVVELEEDEVDLYVDLSERIHRYGGVDSEDGDISDVVKRLLIRRARVVATARQKIELLKSRLERAPSKSYTLIFCGDGSVEGDADGELVRQIEEVRRVVGVELGWRCASYTAETSPARRQELLAQFGAGDLHALLAIRCLDQGVDVPATRVAYLLASSSNPRQYVQRRGRVLRRSEGKTMAEIHDFFVTFPLSVYSRDHPQYRFARGLVRSQLARIGEFCDLATNGPAASRSLLELRGHFELLSEA